MNISTTTTAHITDAIAAYVEAKAAEKRAKAEASRLQAELLALMNGATKDTWVTEDGREYALAATYQKTRKVLSEELVRELLGDEKTAQCYTTSRPWDELRVSIVK